MKRLTLEQVNEIFDSRRRVRIGFWGIASLTGKITAIKGNSFYFERAHGGHDHGWHKLEEVEVWNWRDVLK